MEHVETAVVDEWDFEETAKEVMANPDARAAAIENGFRRELAAVFEAARLEQNLSIRELAQMIKTSKSQVQRLTHKEVGGSLTLLTVIRAAEALGLVVNISVEKK